MNYDDHRAAILDFEIHDERGRHLLPLKPTTHCPRGHEYTIGKGGNKYCRPCSKERERKRRAEGLGGDPAARSLESKRRRPRQVRSAWMLRRYGITLEQFEELIQEQNGQCRICERGITTETQLDAQMKRRATVNTAVVDHDHATGKVRGALCMLCNRGLGDFKDNVSALERAVEYLKGALHG